MTKEITENLAYLRFLDWNNQCTLAFHIDYHSDVLGEIKTDIFSVRQLTETVNALLVHTTNKVLKIFQNHNESLLNKENEESVPADPPIDINISLKNNNKDVPAETLLKQLETFKRLTLSILGTNYKVLVNVPWVESLKLPEVIFSGHAVQPLPYKSYLVIHGKSKFAWAKSKDKVEWTECGNEYHYQVSDDDLEHFLKFSVIPANNTHVGQVSQVISKNRVCQVPQLPYCPFQDRHKETEQFLTGNDFRVVSYNTLSDRYTRDNYDYCPAEHLAIDYRKQLLLKELFGYNADVICCQEMDNKIYSFYFRPAFKKINFGSIYHKKGNRILEGLATFYNKSRFSYVDQGHIVFCNEVKSNQILRNIRRILEMDSETREVFMKQATSLQYLLLRSKNSKHILIVANTHLYYHPDANNVRLLQIAICLEYLKVLFNSTRKKNKNHTVSMLLCGDLNSRPESDVHRFLMNGSISYTSDEYSTSLFHAFQFTSACGTPQFTNYVDDFKACLDYIFCTNLYPFRHVSFPSEGVLAQDVALPSRVFPSDHLALIADLRFSLS